MKGMSEMLKKLILKSTLVLIAIIICLTLPSIKIKAVDTNYSEYKILTNSNVVSIVTGQEISTEEKNYLDQ